MGGGFFVAFTQRTTHLYWMMKSILAKAIDRSPPDQRAHAPSEQCEGLQGNSKKLELMRVLDKIQFHLQQQSKRMIQIE